MWPNSQFPSDLVTFTEELFNGKLHFLYSEAKKFINFGYVMNVFWYVKVYILKVHSIEYTLR